MNQANGHKNNSHYDWDALMHDGLAHRSLYTDPAIFELEMVKVFGGSWTFLGHESEIAKPNDFVSRRLGLRPLIITRDRDGKVHALMNRCSHRGATVCRLPSGSAKFFTCPYHGWGYTNQGELISVPGEGAYGEEYKRSDYNLAHLPRVDSYRGFIFGTLNPEVGPLIEWLAGARPLLDQWLDRYPGTEIVVRSSAQRLVIRANWKMIYDNAGDGYHPAYSHQSLLEIAADRYGPEYDMQYFGKSSTDPDDSPLYVQSLGNGHTFLDQRPEMHADSAWRRQRPQPSREAYENSLKSRVGEEEARELLEVAIGSGMNLTIFPNLLNVGNQLQVLEPLAVDRAQVNWYGTTLSGVPDEINVLRMRTQEDFPALGDVDDNANFEACQAGLAIPEMEWVDISRHLRTKREKVDAHGIITGPVTDDLHMRSYYKEWKRLMSADLKLTVER
jgi:phenylpropionate dioxygenase-like ring-hydroxylating dioxygenase large terminal subunit